MVCLLKAPLGETKGVVVFTTPERDQVIAKDAETRRAVETLKRRFVIGLHHNWHDHAFRYDPLFDFSMAGEGDLREVDNRSFPRIPLDACNFAPECFAPSGSEKFWDVLCISRAVFFKNVPDTFAAIRALYDAGHRLRVLYLCPVPPVSLDTPADSKTDLLDVRARFEKMFAPNERRRFTLLTMGFDYPFPLDLETLAFFYRGSRVFLHLAAEERRVRVAGYAWASGLPVVAHDGTGSLLSPAFRRPPFFFGVEQHGGAPAAILAALVSSGGADLSAARADVASEATRRKLVDSLRELFRRLGIPFVDTPMALEGLDIRLGRHHPRERAPTSNHLPQTISDFVRFLGSASDAQLANVMQQADPEAAIAREAASESRNLVPAAPPAKSSLLRRLFR